MNPFEVFNEKEIRKITEAIGKIENRKYTKEEWHNLENRLYEDIMCKSYKNGDMDKARENLNSSLNKIEMKVKNNI